MRILISNDDGVYSPGIAALAEVAAGFAEVRIVAPDVERSSAGHSITAAAPLSCKRTPLAAGTLDAWRVNGTPADCVTLGLDQWQDVDLVLSGINLGSNLGNAIWHSGTLAAAKQAALLGRRGIAFSTPSTADEPDFALLQPWVATVLTLLIEARDLRLVNVNLPSCRPRGVKWTRQSATQYDGKVVAATDPMGRPHFWYTVAPLTGAEEDTDLWAIEHGYVSVTPLRLDLTNHEALAEARAAFPTNAIAFG
jgi:5'-nucleotidase